MAPPKPSQRGKFRPKKPQKKTSKPPAATATTGTAISSSSSLPSVTSTNPGEGSNFRRNNYAAEASGGRGRGRGGRGRGGRGGRGRGRIPIPQGTVFFTGGEKKPASSAKGSTTKSTGISAGASRNSRKRDGTAGKDGRDLMDTSTEEVVGELDTAIGGSGNTKKESILERDYGDYDDEEGPSNNAGGYMNLNLSAGCMYNSDSSDERTERKSKNRSLIAPLELPFSTKSLSAGVKPDMTNSSHIDEHHGGDCHESAQLASPFVATSKIEGIRDENNSWFLVQLPTRLPPMQKDFSCNENDNDDADGGEVGDQNVTTGSAPSSSASTNNVMNNISEVAVPPVTTSCFDHGLDKNAAGRIGNILVYKSGKTVLVMDGPDDKVSMNVNEGLTCMFHQQAIAVNVKEGHYIALGDVDKSIVISPDLTSI